MKKNTTLTHLLGISFAGIIGLTGCQNMATPISDSQADAAARLVTTGTIKINPQNGGYGIQVACASALGKLNIFPSNDNAKRCEYRAKDIMNGERQQENLQKQAHEKAAEQAQQNAFDRRVAEIRAGRATIQTAQEAAAIYKAADGASVIKKPLLHPDGRYYVIHGVIDPFGGMQAHNFVIRYTAKIDSFDSAVLATFQQGFVDKLNGDDGAPQYARITLMTKATVPANARVGSEVEIVGTYTSNREFLTVAGAKRIMPVFTASFIQVMN